MSTQGKVSLAVVIGGAFLAGILFATAGANLFGAGDAVGTPSQAANLDGSTAIEQSAGGVPDSFATAFTEVAKSANPAVVQIRAAKVVEQRQRNPFEGTPFEQFFGRPGPSQPDVRQGLGSGAVVRSDGHIVTNNHVIEDAEQLSVQTLDGSQYEAKVVGSDPYSDLAVLKIDASDLTAVSFGNSDQLSIGQWVMAFGSPLSPQLNNTVTTGIVSALGRLRPTPQQGRNPSNQSGGVHNFIQTDAAVNPGNSGGPLVNLQGELIGINTAIASQTGGYQGVSFAIPVNTVERVVTQIIEEGDVRRAYLGIRYGPAPQSLVQNEDLPQGSAVISQVESGTPAAEAGLQDGDIITAIGGEPLNNHLELGNQIAGMQPGDEVSLRINREGEMQTFTVTLGARSNMETASSGQERNGAPSSENAMQEELGLQLRDVTPEIARQLGLEQDQGVLITGVDRTNPMIRDSGLQSRQIIFEMAGQKVSDFDALRKMYQNVEPGNAFRMSVRNPDGYVFVTSLRKPENG
jgi:serine protease Do